MSNLYGIHVLGGFGQSAANYFTNGNHMAIQGLAQNVTGMSIADWHRTQLEREYSLHRDRYAMKVVNAKKKIETFREELQAEISEWLPKIR